VPNSAGNVAESDTDDVETVELFGVTVATAAAGGSGVVQFACHWLMSACTCDCARGVSNAELNGSVSTPGIPEVDAVADVPVDKVGGVPFKVNAPPAMRFNKAACRALTDNRLAIRWRSAVSVTLPISPM
jgi:hypothetical protein